ncbi:ABC-type multidrug transport system, ATPase and permease component [hydrothermal vent metagenome]|uniref:ABC-type multidrug transport system, ATPase and permease component n=1 Tax=hydrothermal vent metagenome TaxID=652676 RepID=A0A1W1E8M8_9ZZZZ
MRQTYNLKKLFSYVLAQRGDFVKTILYGIGATLLLLPLPMMIPLLIDQLLLHRQGKLTAFFSQYGIIEPWIIIATVLAAMTTLRIGAFVFENKKTYHAVKITQKIAYLLRLHILHRLEYVSLNAYASLKTGGITSKNVQDVESISAFVGQATTTLLSSLLMLLGVGAVMMWMNWVLALLVLLINPFTFAFSKLLGRKTAKLLKKRHEAYQIYNELLTETLELMMQVRASNREHAFFGNLRQKAKEMERVSLAYSYKVAVTQGASTLLTQTTVDLFRALGIAAVLYSDLSIGMMIGFLFYMATLVQPMNRLSALVMAYQRIQPAINRINTLLVLEREPSYLHKKDPFYNQKSVSIKVENVHFAYADAKTVLHGVSLYAKAGEKVAIVGPSGSGKSTVAQLLVGLYPLCQGNICYGGVSISDIGLSHLRAHVALMLQHPLFFNDTIRMNLTLNTPKSDEEIFAALHAAQLGVFVSSLEKGLETRIGKHGIRLSGGQRQRLAIARLILSDPKVVIFDEATSALDNALEECLYETLEVFLKGRTTIIVAHRTSTIRQADRIYVMENGRVTAHGSYEALQKAKWLKEDFDDE